MTRLEFVEAIDKERHDYRKTVVALPSDIVYSRAYKITVIESLYDFLAFDDNRLTDEDLERLYEKTRGNVLHALSSEYFSCEDCDIAKYDDLYELVKNYLYLWE